MTHQAQTAPAPRSQPNAPAGYVASLAAAFRMASAQAPKGAPAEWFAQRGYRSGAPDGGSPHLTWGRLSLDPRLASAGRSQRSHTAFALAYALGLRDSGLLAPGTAGRVADSALGRTTETEARRASLGLTFALGLGGAIGLAQALVMLLG